jgi:hypothetical protein
MDFDTHFFFVKPFNGITTLVRKPDPEPGSTDSGRAKNNPTKRQKNFPFNPTREGEYTPASRKIKGREVRKVQL